MSADKDRDSRSMSHDFGDDSDEHDFEKEDSAAPSKPGRKKNPNSAVARRDQNRIAQREFRLRKQQRIRDLEARVELLSGTKDETFVELRNIVKDLMQENVTLRTLIKSLSGFIGEGKGGILPQMGFDRPQDFMEFVNKAETDTAFEGFQKRKKQAQAAAAAGLGGSKKRNASEDETARKRARGSTDLDPMGLNGAGKDYSLMMSPAAGSAPASFYPAGPSSSMYMTGSAADSPGYMSASTPSMSGGTQFPGFQPSINVSNALGSPAFMNSTASSASAGPSAPVHATNGDTTDLDEGIDDPKMHEAMKLVHYHLDNYKRNNAYCLPQSLRPTLVQRTVPHESIIDSVPHPELRDRMILLRGRFDLVDALHDYARSVALHGDDVLAHSNWEIGEKWIRQYGFLVDQPVLSICNRWRRERREKEIALHELSNAQDLPSNS